MKLWLITIDGHGYFYPAIAYWTAVREVASRHHEFKSKKYGSVDFRLANRQEVLDYVKDRPDSSFAKSFKRK